MATTARSDLILPSILAEEVVKGVAGMNLLSNTGVVSMNTGLQAGAEEVGNTVTVPYFDSLGEAEEVAENGALTPVKMTQSSETATVIRFGKAVSIGGLAKRAKSSGRDIYDVAREMILAMIGRKVDALAITRMVARVISDSMIYDGSAATISTTAIVGAYKKFGDELMSNGGPVLWGMQSKPYWDAATLADSTGRALFVAAVGDVLASLNGVKVTMSDKSNLLVGTTPAQYYSLLAKRAAVACWMNENVSIEIERDSLADTDVLVVNAYAVVHAYSCMPGGTKPGVAALKSL